MVSSKTILPRVVTAQARAISHNYTQHNCIHGCINGSAATNRLGDFLAARRCAVKTLPTSRLPTSDFRLPTSDFRLPTSGFRLPTSDFRLPSSSDFPVAFKKTKHILRAAEFLRDLVAREVIMLKHLPGKIMIADLLTKAVARPIFLELTRLIAEYAATGVVIRSFLMSFLASVRLGGAVSGPSCIHLGSLPWVALLFQPLFPALQLCMLLWFLCPLLVRFLCSLFRVYFAVSVASQEAVDTPGVCTLLVSRSAEFPFSRPSKRNVYM